MSKIEKRAVNEVFIILGIITAIILIILGCLSWYGSLFITNNVRDELVSQKVYFPPKGDPSFDPKEFAEIQKYAGQIVDDGPKAQAYANGFMKKHLEIIGNGKTYSEVATESAKDPTNQNLQDLTMLMFRGTTLRAMLLSSGYAFWTMGIIAGYFAITAFISAGIIIILTCLKIKKLKKL